MPTGSPLRLPVSSSKRNLRRGLAVTHPKVRGLKIELMFNKNIIKLRDNVEYIKEATDTMAILYIKRGCNCKDNILAYLKASLN